MLGGGWGGGGGGPIIKEGPTLVSRLLQARRNRGS